MDATAKKKLSCASAVIRRIVFRFKTNVWWNINWLYNYSENINDVVEYKVASDTDVFKLINDDLDFAIANLSYKVDAGRYGQRGSKTYSR
jgi:hypothetical protein